MPPPHSSHPNGQQEPEAHGEQEPTSNVSSGESKRDRAAAGAGRGSSSLDRQLRKAMDANLQELELMHKRVNVCSFANIGLLHV